MKLRMIITALCLCLGLCAMAQGHGNRNNRNNRGGERSQNIDMVVDTAIINSMELEPEVVTAVLQLQAQKQEELKAILIKMAQSRKEGQGFDKEAIAEMRQQMDDFKLEYRMQLRKVLGTANYITYLEKQVDNRPAIKPGNTHSNRGDNRTRGNWGQGAGQGNWGGNMGGNNWGDDNTQNGAVEDAK